MKKTYVGAAMLNWRYVGKTFVQRDRVRNIIFKEGPNTSPHKYIEKHDLCLWQNAPKGVPNKGRVIWISKNEDYAIVQNLNRILKYNPNAQRNNKDVTSDYQPMHEKIPMSELTLLDIVGNGVKKVTMVYTKTGDPMRVSESGISIPYQDEVWKEKENTYATDTTEEDLQDYGKDIASLQDIDEELTDNIDKSLDIKKTKGKITKYGTKITRWIKNEDNKSLPTV